MREKLYFALLALAVAEVATIYVLILAVLASLLVWRLSPLVLHIENISSENQGLYDVRVSATHLSIHGDEPVGVWMPAEHLYGLCF